MRAIALAFALLGSVPASAQLPEADNVEATAGKLKVIHLWTKDPEAFLEAWNGPTPPTLPTSSTVQRNVPIQQFILYANCQTNDSGECLLSAKVDIIAPDGEPYGEPLIFAALPAIVPPPENNIGLAPNSIGLVIEDGEQLGSYRIHLAVTDEHAGVTANSVVSIEVTEAED